MKLFLVGGAIRDKLMGKTPKDFDYTAVLQRWDKIAISEMSPFEIMVEQLEKQGFNIFLKTPEHLTVRARFPKGHVNSKLTADFVLARFEGEYTDGRRPDRVEPGTLLEDLSRRDLTFNAIAEGEDGSLIDPFNGVQDILNRNIKAVGDPMERLTEDSLRALRAVRFRATLGFHMDPQLHAAIQHPFVLRALSNVSDERKMDELNKMFRHDSLKALHVLDEYKLLRNVVFGGKVNLIATMKEKGYK